jgi:tellurium resistance protein TerD
VTADHVLPVVEHDAVASPAAYAVVRLSARHLISGGVMVRELERGEEASLGATRAIHARVRGHGWVSGKPIAIDASAFVVSRVGVVLSQQHFVFYGNPSSPDKCLRWSQEAEGDETLTLSLPELPLLADGVVLTGSIDDAAARGASISDLREAVISVRVDDEGEFLAHQLPPLSPDSKLDAAVLAVLLRRDGAWACRAVGESVGGGLAGLATSFGVMIA